VICDYGFTPLLADYIFCWGKLQQNQLKEQGVPIKKIVVTGNPMVKTFDQKQVPQSDTVVCFAISPEILNRMMIELFISAVERIGSIKGMIKLHPSLQKKNYLWINNLSSGIIVKDYTEITNKELFEKIDLLIVHQSGIANEALASGVPVVVLEPDGEANFSELQKELINSAGCKAAVNKDQLIAILNDFISDPKSFKEWSKERSRKYLDYLFEKIGEDSIQAMITGINRLTA
jgi:UDP-N-acetylglucosamine 2-epimerase